MSSIDRLAGQISEIREQFGLRIRIVGFKTKEEIKVENAIKREVKEGKMIATTFINSVSTKKLDSQAFDSTMSEFKVFSQDRTSILGLHPETKSLPQIKEVKSEIVQHALEVIRDRVSCQIASIFTISKDGFLERVGIYGVDKDDRTIDVWNYTEKYEIGSGFVGKACAGNKKSSFGELQFTADLLGELDNVAKAHYLDRFGSLGSSIAIPLNGRNKTYGVLQVTNKSPGFSEEDFRILASLAEYTATALSNFRRDIQVEILKYLSQVLILSPEDSDLVYQQVADLLVDNPETAFKACILRTKSLRDECFSIRALSTYLDGTIGREDDLETRENSPLDGKVGLVGKVIQTGKPIVLKNIRLPENIRQFRNRTWILNKKLDAFGCFPFVFKGEVIGTLSLYTGFNYDFYPDSIDFVQSIANLVASFVGRVKQENREYVIRDESLSGFFIPQPKENMQKRMAEISTSKANFDRYYTTNIKKLSLKTQEQASRRSALLRILIIGMLWFTIFFVKGYLSIFAPLASFLLLLLILLYMMAELIHIFKHIGSY